MRNVMTFLISFDAMTNFKKKFALSLQKIFSLALVMTLNLKYNFPEETILKIDKNLNSSNLGKLNFNFRSEMKF